MFRVAAGGCHRMASSLRNGTWCGQDLAPPERAHQRFAESPLVDPLHVAVGGHDRAQVLAELDIGGRAVVDRANAHVQELRGDVARFLRQRLDRGGSLKADRRCAVRRRRCGTAARTCAVRRVTNASNTADTSTDPSACDSSVGSYMVGPSALVGARSESKPAMPATSTPERRAAPLPSRARA